PALSVTVSSTLNVCDCVPTGSVNVCVTVWPVPDPPSPNDHEKDTTERPGAACVDEASKVTCWPVRGADGLNVKSAVGLPLPTVTLCVATAVRPASSVTVRRTVNVPVFAYACEVVWPVPVVPSPKSHWKLRIVRPGAGRDWLALKLICWPMTGLVGDTTNVAVGSAPWPTVTFCVIELDAPMLSMTVSVTANVPADLNVCGTISPDAVPPSPKFHSHWTIVPVVEVLAEASNSACSLSFGAAGVTVNFGGTVVPPGTTWIVAKRGVALAKSVPSGVITTCTSVVGATPAGAGGAVKVNEARPFASVTRLRADSVPKSTPTPATASSARSDRLRSGWPLLS